MLRRVWWQTNTEESPLNIQHTLERHGLTRGILMHPFLSVVAALFLVVGLWLYVPGTQARVFPEEHTKTLELWATPTTKMISYKKFNQYGPSVRVGLDEFRRIAGDRPYWILISDTWLQKDVQVTLTRENRTVTYMLNLEANKWLYAYDYVPELNHTGWNTQSGYDARTHTFVSRVTDRSHLLESVGIVFLLAGLGVLFIVWLGRDQYWGDFFD